MHPIIIGIDPGTTSAFAALSFDFKVLAVKSRKDYSLAGLISDIYKVGNPILLGTDKKEIPSFIKEFSQKTGAKIYSPKYDTKKGEKNYIVKDKNFSDWVGNTHEIDALASAIYAYNEYLPLIKKIYSYIEKNNKHTILDKIFLKVICEEKNIADAVAEIEKKPIKKTIEINRMPEPLAEKEITKEQKELILLRQHLEKVNLENIELKKKVESLSIKKIDINKETKKIISFKENRALSLEKENKLLKKEIEQKNSIIKKLDHFIAASSNRILIKKMKNLGNEEYKVKKDILSIEKGDILQVEDISVTSEAVLKELNEKIKILIFEKGNNKELSSNFVLLEKNNLKLIETKYFSLTEKDSFEKELSKELKKKEKISLKEIVEEYRRERT